VKNFIARHNVSHGYKMILCSAYKRYAKFARIEWTMPKYRENARPIKTPTKEKVEILIAKAKSPLVTKLQISIETSFRPVEILGAQKTKGIDLEKLLLYPQQLKTEQPK
jgi:hypothetical protein